MARLAPARGQQFGVTIGRPAGRPQGYGRRRLMRVPQLPSVTRVPPQLPKGALT
jgi:hypothetical protein